ncbi:MAG TPA: hypothetical protein VK766_02695 [Cytophagaceae bacterium]|jgi:hypothetical protein|nr:hypothetical protein [Cytophagaceae bacterium]
MLLKKEPLSKNNYLFNLYADELVYINSIMSVQDHHFLRNEEIVVLIDSDFPHFNTLNELKMEHIISIYKSVGWSIRIEKVEERKEYLMILF